MQKERLLHAWAAGGFAGCWTRFFGDSGAFRPEVGVDGTETSGTEAGISGFGFGIGFTSGGTVSGADMASFVGVGWLRSDALGAGDGVRGTSATAGTGLGGTSIGAAGSPAESTEWAAAVDSGLAAGTLSPTTFGESPSGEASTGGWGSGSAVGVIGEQRGLEGDAGSGLVGVSTECGEPLAGTGVSMAATKTILGLFIDVTNSAVAVIADRTV